MNTLSVLKTAKNSSLLRHLRNAYNLTPEAYRARREVIHYSCIQFELSRGAQAFRDFSMW